VYVKDLQNILSEFTEGKKGNDIKHAKIYVSLNTGTIAEVKAMEVQTNNIIGSKDGLRLVMFPKVEAPKIIL
tara:strand:+ start:372 stop:587 length:216 start_codon:yes stop_codon:yes gene_type:complete